MKVTVVIPNYNGMKYLENCIEALMTQTGPELQIIVVDNGSSDSSVNFLKRRYPQVWIKEQSINTGFCHAVNVGIRNCHTKYVILLNNDTQVLPGFIQALVDVMEKPGNEKVFSASAQMLDMNNPELIDDAGDLVCALGWAFARGKGKPAEKYDKPKEVFAACAGAAIYRRNVFECIGFFDESHFAYLEDIDIAYRAKIQGYRNVYEPAAKVLHAGSASSGSRYNPFKTKLTTANNIYTFWKNMPIIQWLFNLPLLLLGYLIKALFFYRKGLWEPYVKGSRAGVSRCRSKLGKKHKVKFRWRYIGNYLRIQLILWKNLFLLFREK
ncbi:MAG: glycosyltransferase family 2 protein [Lachnospiraceae bacterium]|nr:glycosyltransferase family 2 protein [Lachnospiraceae bacterium]